MSPDEIRRSWDDDDTPRSVFPEPLAERLTRENKELRAEVERLTSERDRAREDCGFEKGLKESIRGELGVFIDLKQKAEARLDALVADLRGLADKPSQPGRWVLPDDEDAPGEWVTDLRAVLDKHAGGTHD